MTPAGPRVQVLCSVLTICLNLNHQFMLVLPPMSVFVHPRVVEGTGLCCTGLETD